MTNQELSVLHKLMEKNDTKGKKYLDKFIWLNTTNPKYKIGDCYEITDIGHSICGVPIKDKKGKIVEIINMAREKQYLYVFSLEFQTLDDRKVSTKCYVTETYISKKACDNLNFITKISKQEDTIDIALNGDRAW